MAKVIVWNSIATRKRSPSDGFLENGLGLIKSYLQEYNHEVTVVDWQKNEFYNSLCPKPLRVLNRASTEIMFSLSKKHKTAMKLYFPIFNLLQETVNCLRKSRMKQKLRQLAKTVVKSKVKVFGVKVWYGEAFVWADYLAKQIKKKDPTILLVAGGFHVTLYEEDFLKNSSFDLGVTAQGEVTFKRILNICDKCQKYWDKPLVLKMVADEAEEGYILNLVYWKDGAVKKTVRAKPKMEDKPFPKYASDAIEGKLKVHVLLDSLGCPWGKCSFCVHSHFYPRFFARPVKAMVDEIEYMIKQGVGLFRFAGSETPPAFGVQIAEEILIRGLKIRYSIGCRAVKNINSSKEKYELTVKQYELMLRAGLVALFMGGETANDAINDQVMNKGVTRYELEGTVKAFRQAQKNTGINAYVSVALIYPTPLVAGVTLEDVFNDNLEFVKEVKPDSVIVSPSTPFKNTVWYNDSEKYGFKMPSGFIKNIMKYEYVLYKPPSLWPSLGEIKLCGLSFKEALLACERMRRAVEETGVPSDLTDEFFLMIEGAGYKGKEALLKFKRETAVDLVSSDYRNIERITRLTNEYSLKLAQDNTIIRDADLS
ncbi:MAG: B12-binding domain-containing radical SAM protein [Candidatus Omnitrophica bacterium]|nr:B12-binding domain-containing radical SAM protein [Candidatus Omnitrophota bacterium]